MKRFGCLATGCLGLGAVFAALVVVTLVFMAQNPPLIMPAVAPPTVTPMVHIYPATPTEDASGGIVLVTAQMADNTPHPPTPGQLATTATPFAPVSAPFFGSQTAAAQQSATVMWIARTAWFGALTQGAIDHAATLRALGTPEH